MFSLHSIKATRGDRMQHLRPRKVVSSRLNAAAFALALASCLPVEAHAQTGTLAFRSGFEASTRLDPPSNCWGGATGNGCWQTISGIDASTGGIWPPGIWGGGSVVAGGAVFQLIADDPAATPSTLGENLSNQIVTVEGPTPSSTRSLYMHITKG